MNNILVLSGSPQLTELVNDAGIGVVARVSDTHTLMGRLHERVFGALVLDFSVPDVARQLEAIAGLKRKAVVIALTSTPEEAEAAVASGLVDDSLEVESASASSINRAIRYAMHRRESEWSLAASQAENARLAGIIEAADDLVILVDAAEKVFFLNPSARKFFGDPDLDDVPSFKIMDVFSGADNPGFWHEVLPDVVLGSSWKGDVALTNVHGVSVPHAVSMTHYEKTELHDRAYFSIVCSNLSALEAMAEKAHMEKLLKAKDQFVAAVSHELRTPLTAVLGFAEMMYGGAFEGDVEGAEEVTKLIFSQAQEVNHIIDDLIVGARSDIGTIRTNQSMFDLADEVHAVVDPLAEAMEKDLRIDVDSAFVFADPLRVRQVLRNLLTNSNRYGGPIVRVGLELQEDLVVLLFSDNGEGVPLSQREAIFEPFQSTGGADAPTAMGLGLTVSRQLAQLMGGDLSYDYVDGWSEFRLSLLRREPAEIGA